MQNLPVGPLEPGASAPGKVITYVPLDYPSEEEFGSIDVSRLLGVLRRHLWMIVGVSALTVSAAAFLVSRETSLYQAQALIRLIDPGAGLLPEALGSSGGESQAGMDPMLSAIMVLESRGVLGEVVDGDGLRLFSVSTGAPASFLEEVQIDLPPEGKLDLEIAFGRKDLVLRSGTHVARASYGSPIEVDGIRFIVPSQRSASANLRVIPRERAIDYLERSIDGNVRMAQGGKTRTDGIDIQMTSTDPKIAVKVVNAIAEVYKEHSTIHARDDATRRREFLENQLGENDSLLRVAQSALGGLRGRTQSYSAQQRFAAEQNNLMSVENRRQELSTNRAMVESLLRDLVQAEETGSAANMAALVATPGVANQVISQLHSQLVQYQTARDEAITGPWAKAPSHPEVQRYNTLIASTEQRMIDALRSQIASLDAQIGVLGGQSARAAAAMGQLPTAEIEEMHLSDQVETLRNLGDQLRAAYQTARIEEAVETGNVEIVYLARRASPVARSAAINLILGLVFGLVLGCSAAFVREKMDRSIHHPEELDKLLGVTSLAVIPRITSSPRMGALKKLISRKNGKSNGRSGAESLVHSLDSEAYRVLRTNLLFSPSAEILKTLIVTSAGPKEGKTTTAMNLAAAYAHQGLRVSLLDCDLRRPALANAFCNSRDSELGDLTKVIMNDQEVGSALRPSGIEGLDILATITSPPNPTELLGGASMKRILEELSERYDMVILDTPPVLVAADAAILGSRVDGVLLVVRAGSTERAAAQQAVERLAAVGANVVGVVLNDPDSTIRRYGRHYVYSHSVYPESE